MSSLTPDQYKKKKAEQSKKFPILGTKTIYPASITTPEYVRINSRYAIGTDGKVFHYTRRRTIELKPFAIKKHHYVTIDDTDYKMLDLMQKYIVVEQPGMVLTQKIANENYSVFNLIYKPIK